MKGVLVYLSAIDIIRQASVKWARVLRLTGNRQNSGMIYALISPPETKTRSI